MGNYPTAFDVKAMRFLVFNTKQKLSETLSNASIEIAYLDLHHKLRGEFNAWFFRSDGAKRFPELKTINHLDQVYTEWLFCIKEIIQERDAKNFKKAQQLYDTLFTDKTNEIIMKISMAENE